MDYSISQLASITGAHQSSIIADPDARITGLLFDSRSHSSSEGIIFCAISSTAADGSRYIPEMYRAGIRAFLVGKLPEGHLSMPDASFIVVDNVPKAVERLAVDWRARLGAKVVAITGSAGKTVVKEMLFRMLSEADPPLSVSRSPRSWNSRLGVPLSILEASLDDDAVIIEVGIDSKGDMEAHASLIRPDIGILTAITAEHASGFASVTEKIAEKCRLFSNAKTVICDASDPDALEILTKACNGARIIEVNGASPVETDMAIAREAASIILPESQSAGNPLPVTNRIDVHEGINDCVMLYDGFTNDLRSLRWALDFMRRHSAPTRTSTAILADLFHPRLSESSLSRLYSALGELLANFGITRLIAVGREISAHAACFPTDIEIETVPSPSAFLAEYDINRFSSETILIAGGPGSGFLEIRQALESPRHDTIMEVNLDAIVHNFNHFRSKISPSTGIIAMVKASAYGMGAPEIARTLAAQGAAYLAVAVIDEGIELRRSGIKMPIMVLNPVTTNYRALFRHALEPSVFSLRELDTLIAEARKDGNKDFSIHIKLDTGMHRVGFTPDEIPMLLQRLSEAPEVHVASVFSHLATADCIDQEEYTSMQLREFRKAADTLKAALPYPVKTHILNTAGIMTRPDDQHDMVRLGIGLYGIDPFGRGENLRPVATLKTTIISIRRWDSGTTIGYGRKGRLERPSAIATLPVGYADGIDRRLSCGVGRFMVKGVECPVVGNICMDQCMIDVTDVPSVAIGDEVTIFGAPGSIERMAQTLDTIPYEIMTSVAPRVRRIYYRD